MPTDRWQHLLNAAFHLGEQQNHEEQKRALARAIDSGLEVFGANIDPLEDFEGYAVRRFLVAAREALASGSA